MQLRDLKFRWRAPYELPYSMRKVFAPAVAHIDEKATVGVPYSRANIIAELQQRYPALALDDDFMRLAGKTLETLISEHGWAHSQWGVMVKLPENGRQDGRLSLRYVLDGAIPSQLQYSVPVIADWVYILTGEEVDYGNLRKALARLVKQERFIRCDKGVYKRTAIGI